MKSYSMARVIRAARHCSEVPQYEESASAREIGRLMFEAEIPEGVDTIPDARTELEVRFVEDRTVGRELYVVFDYLELGDKQASTLSAAEPTEGGGFVINSHVLELYQRTAATILESIARVIVLETEDGEDPFTRTIYTGTGIGAALGTLIAVQSPPHSIINFGMPAFCNKKVETQISDLVKGREDKMKAKDIVPTSFEFLSVEDADDAMVSRILTGPYARLGTVLQIADNGIVENPSMLRRLWHKRNAYPFHPDWDDYYFYALVGLGGE